MTTPIEMPNPLPVNSKLFDLEYNQDVSPVGTGFIQAIQRAPPRWVAQYSTPPLRVGRDVLLQAFLDNLEGAMIPFLAFDPRKVRPWTERNTVGNTWENTLGVSVRCVAGNHTLSSIELDRAKPGFTLTQGDMVAFQRGNAWYLHRVTLPAVADGSGIMNVSVTPRPLDSVTPVNVRLERACCAMKVVGKIKKSDKVDDPGPAYTWQAVQFIDRT